MLTTPIRKSYRDYCELPEEARYELIEGELLMTPSPSRIHQKVAHRLNEAISSYVAAHRLGEVYFAPLDVVLSEYDVVQPDLFFVSHSRREILKEENIQGAPDLVVEITSSSSRERDRLIKKGLYARYGVQEYWLVDLERQSIEVLSSKKTEYHLVGIFLEADLLSTPLFSNLQLPVGPVFKRE